jgi:phage host-nuclease inhibitor protein Gam
VKRYVPISTNVPTAVLAFDEREHDELLAEDLGAIVARIGDLTRVARRHEPQMTDEQRRALTEYAEELDDLTPEDPP